MAPPCPLPAPGGASRGFLSAYVLLAMVMLLLFATVVYRLVSTRYGELSTMRHAQLARLLARAGADYTLRALRKELEPRVGGGSSALFRYLLETSALNGTDLGSYLGANWTYGLKDLARTVGPATDLSVTARLDEFRATEEDVKRWKDPAARRGMMVLEVRGTVEGITRTLHIRRSLWVGSILPPLTTRFTLRLTGAGRQENRFNVLRNTYEGKVVGNLAPWIFVHHATPADPWQPMSLDAINRRLARPDGYQEQGWIWLGGGRTDLHLTSGVSDVGEDFMFYPLDDTGKLETVRYLTATEALPLTWKTPRVFPCFPGGGLELATGTYDFGHWLFLMGFHDVAEPKGQPPIEPGAMYKTAPEIFSAEDQARYGANSSVLHLFGRIPMGSEMAGFRSPTRVFGAVHARFPVVGYLDARPQEQEIQQVFLQGGTGPLYPLFGGRTFSPEFPVTSFPSNPPGGPILSLGDLFATEKEYKSRTSLIMEYPYAELYNLMYEQNLPPAQRSFPVIESRRFLREDPGGSVVLKRDGGVIYDGPVQGNESMSVMKSRVQASFETVEQFWDRFYDSAARVLRINGVVRIRNAEGKAFIIPPETFTLPLQVNGGGLILLDNGDVEVRGVDAIDPGSQRNEALTVVAPTARRILFRDRSVSHLNIVAPSAEVVLARGMPATIHGSLEAENVSNRLEKTAMVHYRESQDPTREGYKSFTRCMLRDADEDWHD